MYKLNKEKYNPVAKASMVVKGENYRITILSDALIRFEYEKNGNFQDQATTLAINRDFPEIEYKVYRRNGNLYIDTEKLELVYDEQEPSYYGLKIKVIDSVTIWNYGKQEIGNLGGTVRTLDQVDGATDLGRGLISSEGYVVIDDSQSATIDSDAWIKAAEKNRVDLYFFGHGKDYQAALNDFYTLSGQTPLLPRFALGNWWSRFHKYDETEYLDLMDKFSEKNIPISVAVIDMDWHITEVDPKYLTGWTGYTWNKDLFPDPERFLSSLHERGIKTSLNVHPAEGIRPYETQYNNMCKSLGIDPEKDETIEFDFNDKDFVKAYFEEINHPLEDMGVDFWWIDWQQGTKSSLDGVDPLWTLNHYYYLDSCESEHTKESRDDRGLILSRYAGLGSHRYPLGFSGDTHISWESLDFQPYFTATASNVGYSWWSHDIGGHFMGTRDDELMTRWVQYSVYSPILRLHSGDNPFASKEPWNYKAETEVIVADALRFRHRLIPYLYTMNYRTTYKNEPLVKPLYYLHQNAGEAYNVHNEYYFGSELLVCPITQPVDKETQCAQFSAWLPEGNYFDINTGRLYKGDKSLNLYRNISEIPVFAKAGAIVPLDNAEILDNAAESPQKLLIKVFNGESNSFKLVEDTHEFTDPEPKDLAITNISYEYRGTEGATLKVVPEGNLSAIPENRELTVQIYGVEQRKIEVEGVESFTADYKQDKRVLELSLGKVGRKPISIHLADASLAEIPAEAEEKSIFDTLNLMQIKYDTKLDILNAYKKYGNSAKWLSSLYSNPKIDNKVVDVLAEYFYAKA